jgi:hypothetical protein
MRVCRVLVVFASLLLVLAGCSGNQASGAAPFTSTDSRPMTSPTAAGNATQTAVSAIPRDLPWATLTTTTPAAPVDPGSPLMGQTATPIGSGVVVFAGPSLTSTPVAALPPTLVDSATSLPVIGRRDGFYEVLLPSRRHRPSQDNTAVNHASGWVQAEALTLRHEERQIVVDRQARTVKLLVNDAVAYTAPIELSGGDASVTGRTFIASIYSTPASKQCSGQPMLVTAHQSETQDEYLAGDQAAVQALHGFNDLCKVSLAVTTGSAATPGCTIISDEAVRELLARGVGPGVPVIVQ